MVSDIPLTYYCDWSVADWPPRIGMWCASTTLEVMSLEVLRRMSSLVQTARPAVPRLHFHQQPGATPVLHSLEHGACG